MTTIQVRLLSILLLISAGLNVGLGRMVVANRNRGSQLVPVGTTMPALRVKDRSNASTTIRYSDAGVPTLVYIFSPKCGFCKRNGDNIAALERQTAGRVRVIGVTTITDGLAQFISDTGMNFPVYTDLDPSLSKAYHTGATPQTFVIGNDGRLRQAWAGAYGGSVQKNVESFLSIHLPGLPAKHT
jgi:peroxiredoxin